MKRLRYVFDLVLLFSPSCNVYLPKPQTMSWGKKNIKGRFIVFGRIEDLKPPRTTEPCRGEVLIKIKKYSFQREQFKIILRMPSHQTKI